MATLAASLTREDVGALIFFMLAWFAFEYVVDHSILKFRSLTGLMAHKRREWMLVLADRDMRMIDTAIITGLQQGAAFFGSASMLALGGCFALLGATDQVLQIYRDIPVAGDVTRQLFEAKVLGLIVIFVYAFFKFAWAYRLFNYCSILIGAVPHVNDASLEERRREAMKAGEMNINASRHFTAGLRGIFFALAYLGWFVGPFYLAGSTLFVVIVLARRQYFSKARNILAR
ncbi:MAG: DUF599 family protein [Rhizobiaceae bacterium]